MKNADIKLNIKGFNYYCRYQENTASANNPIVCLSGVFPKMERNISSKSL